MYYINFVNICAGIITKQDEADCVCSEIRHAAGKVHDAFLDDENSQGRAWSTDSSLGVSLSDFELGHFLAKGCNAAVVAARWAREGWQTVSGAFENVQGPSQEASSGYPLAIKMMFNYDAESNAFAILNTMHK